ncbi:MAG TPA: histidine kinase dimerization/phospho-acceptor domain-containing protein, partial [Gammaproteobacteria bacterium]|nr:histidine kinase dimerization/phospho-acceptor domain-containing protein [Gammaproteobacteria bacterium]
MEVGRAATAGAGETQTWKPLRLFSLYRLVLAGLFLTLALTDNLPPPIGEAAPVLFNWATAVYLTLAVLARFAVQAHWPRFNLQVFGQVLVDVAALTVLAHASGGVSSGLGMLLVVAVAGGSILTQGRVAGLFAAVAALAVLGEEVYTQLYIERPETSYPQAGMLGVALFATAFLAQVLSKRIRESEALATRRGVDLANMAQLTEYVVQQLDTGVVVVDPDGRIRLLNEAAGALLGDGIREGAYLEGVVPSLAERLRAWRKTGPADRTLHITTTDAEVIPRFIDVGAGPAGGTLILLEDAAAAARQAQQLKLAALGRLTGSIAHEVRNPLGAISHAGELLGESPDLPEGDRRLVEIVLTQSKRVNAIVENVLGLGRRDR